MRPTVLVGTYRYYLVPLTITNFSVPLAGKKQIGAQ